MIIFDDTNRFSQFQESCVATIGKFDGVHLGHQLILDQLKEKAEQFNLPSLVILLEPHPEEFFASVTGNCPARLTSVREKLELLESFGVDFVFQLKFDEKLAQQSPEDYIQEIIIDGLGVASFIVGDDWRFGNQRKGDFAMLQKWGAEHGFEVVETAAYERNGQRISSTFIREQLSSNNFHLVEQLLGRAYSIKGEVIEGQKLGSELGFPTCNINPHRRQIPLHGVFACEARLADVYLPAVVNIGYRPTVSSDDGALLEVHLLDFEENLYGRTMEIIFKQKIRDEIKFDGLDSLKKQIAIDVAKVREAFSTVQSTA